MLIHPLTLVIQLLSNKQTAYCPSWVRKKNASRERFWYDVRLKMEKKTSETTQRRTKERTTVERDANTNVAYEMHASCVVSDLLGGEEVFVRLTTAAVFSPASNATKRGRVAVSCGVLITNGARRRLWIESKADLQRDCSGQTGKRWRQPCRLGRQKKKERDQSRRTNPG